MITSPDQTIEILQIYQANIEREQLNIRQKKKIKNGLALARFGVAILGAALFYFYWPAVGLSALSAICCGIALAILVFIDAGKTDEIKNHERLIRINQHEIDALQHQLSSYEDGQHFADPLHPYSSDLDIFGPFSLFQFLNRCHADQSKKLLADHLLNPLPVQQIRENQEAAKEISKKTGWSQQFRSSAMANPISFRTEKRLQQWLQDPAGVFEKPYWKLVVLIYTLISLTVLVLYVIDLLSFPAFIMAFICFLGISSGISAKINPTYLLLSKIEPEMNALYDQLFSLEKESFKSSFLLHLKNNIGESANSSASAIIRKFRGILKRFEYRLNLVVFVFLNTFLLWDLRQMLSLIAWKKENKNSLSPWFHAISETEVIISLASVVKNEPAWRFPQINDQYFNLKAEDLGHPLIPADKCIKNSFGMERLGKMAIITGSNMAGKSTFLRSLGTNLVLAFMGAPVCAKVFEASHSKLVSSMRVADNLAENTSTFYAELKKLQYIIEMVNRQEPVFILLDEVLRGTNSTDRHAGTTALIRQLIQQKAVAVVATHNTELAKTEFDYNPLAISNYHFDGQILAGELYFDYALRKGICESLNATLLMKKIGIHFQE